MKKERPILFSTPMVQAILEGRKTQTRRVIKPQPKPEYCKPGGEYPNSLIKCDEESVNSIILLRSPKTARACHIKDASKIYNKKGCPYGQPGDLLWVRENWASSKALDKVKPSNILSGFPCEYQAGGTSLMNYNELIDRGRWRPSIHMPKHAARIWLKVKDVRVERVHQISFSDSQKEGILFDGENWFDYLTQNYTKRNPIASFSSLWVSINGTEKWNNNPWVWVITFEELSRTGRPEPETSKEISNKQ